MFMDVLTEGESTPRLLKRGSKGAHGHSLPKRQAADDFSSPASAWTVLAAGDPRGLSREGQGPTARGDVGCVWPWVSGCSSASGSVSRGLQGTETRELAGAAAALVLLVQALRGQRRSGQPPGSPPLWDGMPGSTGFLVPVFPSAGHRHYL